jgi:hypothetical protein
VQSSVTPVPSRRRPRAITFVASLLLAEALLVVLFGILIGAGHAAGVPTPDFAPDNALSPIVTVLPALGLPTIIVVAGGGLALTALGLFQLREWGWTLAMALQGLLLSNALYAYVQGAPQYFTLALCSFVVLVLNQREVRQAFATRHTHG